MPLRGWIKRLERESRGELVEIPREDGTVARFSEEELKAAYLNVCERLGAGADAPPEHPFITAVRNSPDPKWRNTFYLVEDPDEWIQPVEDLSQ
jgi:hypothetical protein